MKLRHYHEKRRFEHTPEPKGKKRKSGKRRIFVVQMHAASHLHYDFRLEVDGVLKSWAVPKGPCLDPKVKRLAVHVEDHPIEYADFEGNIPKGHYGAGAVMVWDNGTWEEVEEDKKKKNEDVAFYLYGEKLKGKWKLVQIKTDPKNWLLIKVQDEYAHPLMEYNIVEQEQTSVLSGRNIAEIAKNSKAKRNKIKKNENTLPDLSQLSLTQSELPVEIHPQLATLTKTPPKGKEWLHEMKLDGYRLLCFVTDKVKLVTRGQKDWTRKFKPIANEMTNLNLSDTILDGEIVAIDHTGRPSFQLLQNVLNENVKAQMVYYVFDLIFYQGFDLRMLPLEKRKEILKQILPKDTQLIRYCDHVKGSGERVFEVACEMGFEGVISKNIDSKYVEKRTKSWLKIKCSHRQEFVVGGMTKPQGERGHFGALLLGYYSQDELVYCGRVGTGFTDSTLRKLYALLSKYKTVKSPFIEPPLMNDLLSWVKPKIVVEVEFTEWTDEGVLRHPSFKGQRWDKQPKEIVKEEEKSILSSNNGLSHQIKSEADHKITNPDRILYPRQDITKIQLAQFYEDIQDWILPYVIERPLTLLRCPDGIDGERFYQKHLPKNTKLSGIYAVETKITTDQENYLYIKDIKGLLSLVQMSVLEIHTWGCRIDNIEKPDLITFDLDPGEGVTWKEVVNAAFTLKEELENYSLTSFVKTTGGKGLHLCIPIKRLYEWEDVFVFTQAFAKYIAIKYPKKYIDTMSKSKRVGKIFIDYLRNKRGATAVAPYSTRASENAPVSTPLSWQELTPKIKSAQYTIDNLKKRLSRIKSDPWEAFLSLKQSLPHLRGDDDD